MILDSIHFVFFGTPELSVDILECLKKHGLTPSLVITNPDKPQGRKMTLTPPPVKLWAQENRIPFLQPEKLDLVFNSQLTTYDPQLFIVVAYGKIIPKSILAIPSKGTLNIHYSLLPKYRGATPIESQILNDEKEVGVTIMLMDEKMDHGPIVAKQQLEITNHNKQITNKSQITNGNQNIQTLKQLTWPFRANELRSVMNEAAGELLVKTIPRWVAGEIGTEEQDHTKATYTKKLSKADGQIDLSGDSYKNFLKIRAFDDSIGTYFFTHKNGRKIRVLVKDAEFKDLPAMPAHAGQAGGKLKILKVLQEGKKEMSYEEFSRGFVL